jgi:hypothetical protein
MADYNLTQLNQISQPQSADLLYLVRPSSGISGDFKIQATSLQSYCASQKYSVATDNDRLNTNWGRGNAKVGDIVFVVSTGIFYEVIDTNHLDSDMGYAILPPAGNSVIQFRQGTLSEVNSIIPALGEPIVITDYPMAPVLRIGNGYKTGGFDIGPFVTSYPVSGDAFALKLLEFTGRSASAINSATGVNVTATPGAGSIDISTFHDNTGQGARGAHSIAIGNTSLASGFRAMAVGYGAIASGGAAASFGVNSWALAANSLALGGGAIAKALKSAALGVATVSVGRSAVGIGENGLNYQPYSFGLGSFDTTCGFSTQGMIHLHRYVNEADLTNLTADGQAPTANSVSNLAPNVGNAYNITSLYDDNQIVLPTFGAGFGGASYEADITVVGHNYGSNDACCLRRRALLVHNGTSWSLVGSVQTVGVDLTSAGAATWSTTITVDSGNNKLLVKAQGSLGAFTFFSARVEFTSMVWNG